MTVRYRIGEFADLGGVSAKTLRFYDEIDLLRPASIDPRTRYRFYLAHQLQELAQILSLKEAGVPLAEVRALIRKADSPRGVLIDLKKRVEQSIETAKRSLNCINAALGEIDKSQLLVPVTVKRRPAVLVASIRSQLRTYSGVEALERKLLAEVPSQSRGDLRGVLWHRCADSGCLEGEAFVALRERLPRRDSYDLRQLPSATVACAYSSLDDDSAERSYSAIQTWMNARGYRLSGPKREIYLDELLEIQFPLTSQ